jgi:hypothetical protein
MLSSPISCSLESFNTGTHHTEYFPQHHAEGAQRISHALQQNTASFSLYFSFIYEQH